MALPALAKTWLFQKYAVQVQQRTIAVAAGADAVNGGTRTWTFAAGAFTTHDVGRVLRVAGAANGGNNTDHVIATFISATQVTTTTVTTPVTETFGVAVTAFVVGMIGNSPTVSSVAPGPANNLTVTGLVEMTAAMVGRYITLGGFVERFIIYNVADNVVGGTRTWTITNAVFTAADVGRILRIRGATNAANNADHIIATFVNATTVTTTVATTPVDEAFTADVTTWVTTALNGTFKIVTFNSATSVDIFSTAPLPPSNQTGSKWSDPGMQQGAPGIGLAVSVVGGIAGAGNARITGLFNMTTASVGRKLCLSGFTTPGNNSDADANANSTCVGFTIVAFVNSTSVDVANASAAVEAATATGAWSEREPSTNQAVGTGTGLTVDVRLQHRKLYDMFKSMVNLGWEVLSSCDGHGTVSGVNFTSAADQLNGGDYLDRQFAPTKQIGGVGAGVNHSWIVFRNRSIGPNFQLMIDMANTSNAYARGNIRISKNAGFGNTTTGGAAGTGTTAPTAGDQQIPTFNDTGSHAADGLIMGGHSAGFSGRMNMMTSTDKECTRFFYYESGFCQVFALFDVVQNPSTPTLNHAPVVPYIAAWGSTTVFPVTQGCCGLGGNVANNSGQWWFGGGGLGRMVGRVSQNGVIDIGGSITISLTMESAGTSGSISTVPICLFNNQASEINGEFAMQPFGLVYEFAPRRGRVGQIFDLWGTSPVLLEGDTFPSTGTLRQFIVVGELVLPWDLSTPSIA